MKVTQLSVFLENKSGRLADVTKTLAEAEINVRAMSIADTKDYGILRLIVNDTQKAQSILSDAGFTVKLTEVLALEVPDRPGGLAYVIEVLAGNNVNIEYLYAFVGKSGENAIVIFRVEDIDKAIPILQANNITLLSGEIIHSL